MTVATKKPARKRGRPALPPEEGKRHPLNVRTTKELREKLDAAIRQSGRSLTQEIELRLERSFRDEEGFGGKENYALFKMMGGAADVIQARTGKLWMADWDTSVSVRAAWKRLASDAAPKPPRKIMQSIRDQGPTAPTPLPRMIIQSIRDQGPTGPTPPELPKPRAGAPVGLLSGFRTLSDEEQRAYEKESAAYEKARSNYMKRLKKYQREQQLVQQHIDSLLDLGREVASGLFPERPKR